MDNKERMNRIKVNKLTEVIGKQLWLIKTPPSITPTYTELHEYIAKWEHEYRNSSRFHAEVTSLVANVIRALEEDLALDGDINQGRGNDLKVMQVNGDVDGIGFPSSIIIMSNVTGNAMTYQSE